MSKSRLANQRTTAQPVTKKKYMKQLTRTTRRATHQTTTLITRADHVSPHHSTVQLTIVPAVTATGHHRWQRHQRHHQQPNKLVNPAATSTAMRRRQQSHHSTGDVTANMTQTWINQLTTISKKKNNTEDLTISYKRNKQNRSFMMGLLITSITPKKER